MSNTNKSKDSPRTKHRKGSGRRYGLNVSLVFWTLVIVTLGSPAVYFLHAYQVDRGAAAFLSHAAAQEKAEEWQQAAESLHRYLRLRPDDAEARARLANDFTSGATTVPQKARAIALCADALSSSPENLDLQRKQMQLYLDINDFTLALDRADKLLKQEPSDPAALRAKALGLLARWRFKSEGSPEVLVEQLEEAIAKNGGDALLASELARIYRTQRLKDLSEAKRQALADETMQRLIDNSDKKSDALLARYAFRTEFGIDGADADLDQAVAADSERKNLIVRLTAASRAYQKGEWKAAAELFEQAIKIEPKDPRGYLGLGQSRQRGGDEAGAMKAWRLGLERADASDMPLQWRVMSSQMQAGNYEDAEERLNKLQKQVDRLLGAQKDDWLGNVYSARADLALARKEYRAAIDALNEVLRISRSGLQTPERVAAQTRLEQQLGGCHAALRQWDEAASAWQRAITLRPNLAAPRFSAAAAWEAAGRLDEAVREYEDGLAIEQAAAPLRALAHLRFRQQLVLPKDKRDWGEFSESIAKAQDKSPDDTSLKLLGAEFEIEQNRPELALDVLHQAEADALTSPALSRRLLFDYERCQRPEEADRVLENLSQRDANSLATLLLTADLSAARGQLAEAVASIEKRLADLPADERRDANYRLALLEVSANQRAAASERLTELARSNPNDLEVLELRAELSLESDDLDQVQTCADAIKKVEGRDGTVWRFYQAQRLLRESAKEKSKASAIKLLDQARVLAEEVERRRPNWALGKVLKARVCQSTLRPDYESAVKAYFQALRFGENRLRIYEELVLLLYQQNRLVEAATYLDRLRSAGSLSPLLNDMAIAVDARQGNLTRAIESARHDLAAAPDNALVHLRLGQLLAQPAAENDADAPARLAEAETELRRATELAAADTRSWLSLLTFYVQTKNSEAAKSLLQEIERNEKLTSAARPFVLAQGYSLIQQPEQAADYFREAVSAAPDDLTVLTQAARFFFDRDKAQAEAYLAKAHDIAPEDAGVRRSLAALRATQSMTAEDLESNLALLDGAEAGGASDAADQRLKAVLLLKRGGTQSRSRAQKLLEAIVGDGRDAAPIDRLLLAKLYEARGEKGLIAAREQLEALVNRDKPRPDHLAIYIDHLLRNDEANQATAALDQLSELEPATSHLRTLSLRARWLRAQGRSAEIASLVETFERASLPKRAPAEQGALLREIANLYSLVELETQADAAFRRAVEVDPASYAAFAMWLVRHNRSGDAIEICSQAAETDTGPRPAMTLCTVLALGEASDEQRRAAGAVIEKALSAHAQDSRLLFSAATMRLMEGKSDEAIELLRQVLRISPNNLQAMNNLAMLLAERPEGRKEALTLVDRAIALKGLDAELLDTKGWILLRQKQAKEAEAAFVEALEVLPPGDPRHQIHLAMAYQAQGKLNEARQTLSQARGNKLAAAKLSPEEQKTLDELEAALK